MWAESADSQPVSAAPEAAVELSEHSSPEGGSRRTRIPQRRVFENKRERFVNRRNGQAALNAKSSPDLRTLVLGIQVPWDM